MLRSRPPKSDRQPGVDDPGETPTAAVAHQALASRQRSRPRTGRLLWFVTSNHIWPTRNNNPTRISRAGKIDAARACYTHANGGFFYEEDFCPEAWH